MAQALFANTLNKYAPFFITGGSVHYVQKNENLVHFVVESKDGFHTCQAGATFSTTDVNDIAQLKFLAQLLDNDNQTLSGVTGKPLRFIAKHSRKGTVLQAVVHPSLDLAFIINYKKMKLYSISTAFAILKELDLQS